MVDEAGIARDGLCARFEQINALQLDGAFCNGREAIRAVATHHPDIIIMDFAVAMKTGPRTIAYGKRRWPGVRVLVLSARRAGADRYVLRDDRRVELLRALERSSQQATAHAKWRSCCRSVTRRSSDTAPTSCASSERARRPVSSRTP